MVSSTEMECVFMVPSWQWMLVAVTCIAFVTLVQGIRMMYKWHCKDSKEPGKRKAEDKAGEGEEAPLAVMAGPEIFCSHR